MYICKPPSPRALRDVGVWLWQRESHRGIHMMRMCSCFVYSLYTFPQDSSVPLKASVSGVSSRDVGWVIELFGGCQDSGYCSLVLSPYAAFSINYLFVVFRKQGDVCVLMGRERDRWHMLNTCYGAYCIYCNSTVLILFLHLTYFAYKCTDFIESMVLMFLKASLQLLYIVALHSKLDICSYAIK